MAKRVSFSQEQTKTILNSMRAYFEILKTIHPHPTLSEAIHEATADALNEAIHI